jgi:uncharacterized protein YchJ
MAEASRIRLGKLTEWATQPGHCTDDRFIRVCCSHINAERKIDDLTMQLDRSRREAMILRQALQSIETQADDALAGRPTMTARIG